VSAVGSLTTVGTFAIWIPLAVQAATSTKEVEGESELERG
jgi:hypothetical protein